MPTAIRLMFHRLGSDPNSGIQVACGATYCGFVDAGEWRALVEDGSGTPLFDHTITIPTRAFRAVGITERGLSIRDLE